MILSMNENHTTVRVRTRTDSNSSRMWLQLRDSNLGHTGERRVLSHTPSMTAKLACFSGEVT